MATSNNRDVRLGIEIETAGEESVKRLAGAVRALGKEGDPAAAEFNRLADEIDRLAAQAGAVQSVQKLRSEVDQLALAEREAAAAAKTASTQFVEQKTATDALREAQRAAVAEVRTAKTTFDDLVLAYRTLKNEGKSAAESQAAYTERLRESKQQVDEQNRALQARRDALVATNVAVRDAEKAETRLRAELDATGRAAATSLTAIREQGAAMIVAGTAATALGADISDLAGTQTRLRTALEGTAGSFDGLRTGAAAMRALETASREADAQVEALAASLRETEAVTKQYSAATEQAAAAGGRDATTTQARLRAADALIASERSLTTAQRELAAERDRGRAGLIAEAQALLRVAAAARETQAATVTAATAAKQAGAAIESAFGATGIRSIDAIQREVDDTARALVRLESAARRGAIGQDDLARASGAAQVKLAGLRAEINQVQATPNSFERISASISGLISRFGALGAAVATVGVAVRPVLEATVALDQMRRVLTTVTGSAESAEKQIEFLRRTSQQSGQSFTEVGQSYAKFAASALQSGLSIEQTQAVFKSVALAAGNLGLSSDQAKRALEALSQIASKGVVSMEELRQQLGDALPGVLPLLARELGLTQKQLNKVVESGQLLASEAIPAIGRALTALQPQSGVVNGLVAEWNRFINVVKQAGTTLVEGPLGQAAGTVVSAFGGVLRDVSVIAVSASEAFKLLGFSVLSVLSALKGDISFQQLGQQLSDFAQQSGDRIAKFKDIAYGTSEGVKALGTDLARLGDSFAKLSLDQQTSIDAAVLAAQSSEKNTQAKKVEGEASLTLAGLIGDETVARSAAVEAARANVLAAEQQLKADQGVVTALTAARDATIAKATADRLGLDAVKGTIDALDIKIAKATADVGKTQAQADASRAHAAALELANEKIKDNSGRIEQFKRNVEAAELALQTKIRALTKDATTADEVKKATEALAIAKGKLRDAVEDLTEALNKQIAAMKAEAGLVKAGVELEIQKLNTKLRAAKAQGDETTALQLSIKIRELEQSLTKNGIDLSLQEAAATLRSLDAREKELRALGLLTPELEDEIRLRRIAAQTAVLEAAGKREASKAGEEEVKALREGKTAREGYTKSISDSSGATEKDTGSTKENTGAQLENQKALLERAGALATVTTALEAQRLVGGSGLGGIGPSQNGKDFGVRSPGGQNNQLTADGGASLSTSRPNDFTPVDNTGPSLVAQKLLSGTLGQEDLQLVESVLRVARENLANLNNLRTSADGIRDARNQYETARIAYERLTSPGVKGFTAEQLATLRQTDPGGFNGAAGYSGFGSYGRSLQPSGSASGAGPRLATGPLLPQPDPFVPSKGYQVTVIIGGVTTAIGAASKADADNVIRMLEEAYRAGGGTGP